jgi:hypothetical protein
LAPVNGASRRERQGLAAAPHVNAVDGDLAVFSEIGFGTGDHGFTKLENRGGR